MIIHNHPSIAYSFEPDLEKNHSDDSVYSEKNHSPVFVHVKPIVLTVLGQFFKICRLKFALIASSIYISLTIMGITYSYIHSKQYNSSWGSKHDGIFKNNTHLNYNEVIQYSPTLGIDLMLSNPTAYQFNWAHWLNLTDQLLYRANGYSSSVKPLTKFAEKYISSSYFDTPAPLVLGSDKDIRWIGHSYLAFHAPSPARIILLAENDEYNWPVDTSSDDDFYRGLDELLKRQNDDKGNEYNFPIDKTENTLSPTMSTKLASSVIKTKYSSYKTTSVPHYDGDTATNDVVNYPNYDKSNSTYSLARQSTEMKKLITQEKNPKKPGRRFPQPDELIIEFLHEFSNELDKYDVDILLQTALNLKANKFSELVSLQSLEKNPLKLKAKSGANVLLTPIKRFNPSSDFNKSLTSLTPNLDKIPQSVLDSKKEKYHFLSSASANSGIARFFFFIDTFIDSVSHFFGSYPFYLKKNNTKENDTSLYECTYEETIRRVYASINESNKLTPLYDKLQIPLPVTLKEDSFSKKIAFERALNVTASRVLLKGKMKENFHFDLKDHTMKQINTLLYHQARISPKQNDNQDSLTLDSQDSLVETPSLEELFHAQFVLKEIKAIEKSPKYFHEVSIRVNGRNRFKHADWRFFDRALTKSENVKVLHSMFRAWSQFATQEGIVSWLAHGTLLGWYWNGLSMPYDQDMDIQMPIAEMDRLARKYNNTLIVVNPKGNEQGEGGQYLLEVAPTYVERRRGNGNNVIDARFVDTSTGTYIDLTGLARVKSRLDKNGKPTNDDKQATEKGNSNAIYACKNNHYYSEEDLFPLRLTSFEGAPIYVPNNYTKILQEEYRNYNKTEFRNQRFAEDLRIWVDSDKCKEKFKILEDYTKKGKHRFIQDERQMDRLRESRFCNSKEVEEMYHFTKTLTMKHQQEIKLLEELTENESKPLDEIENQDLERIAMFGLRQEAIFN